jgi:hypothetical protein
VCDNFKKGLVRNNYFHGKLLTADDLKTEQEYFISKRRLFNKCMYGCRIVCGCEVDLKRNNIFINKGLCLDCCGREIFIPDKVQGPLPRAEGINFLVLFYKEIPIEPIPIVKDPALPNENTEHSRILESYELSWQTENPLLGHEIKDGGWQACGDSHPVPIAAIFKQRNSIKLIDYKRMEKEPVMSRPIHHSRRK